MLGGGVYGQQVEQLLHVPPDVDPEAEEEARDDGEVDGDEDVDEEGEEGPEHERQTQDDDGEHILEREITIYSAIFLIKQRVKNARLAIEQLIVVKKAQKSIN